MTKMDTKGIDTLRRMLSGKMPVARVGILGKSNSRKGDGSNASIGAKHEFGQEGMPIRSFLRVPLSEHFEEYLKKSGLFKGDLIKDLIREKEITYLIKIFGMIGETIVSDAFKSGGFGKWKPSNMKFKKNHQTLVETQQLRDSITSMVVK